MTPSQPPIHVCIATGQNAANLIPLEQLDAREVWILQTSAMRIGASHLKKALQREGRVVQRIDFDDSSPEALIKASQALAWKLDGRDVVLHVTGGTKLMVLALREELRVLGASTGVLDTLYVDTSRQQLDWLSARPRTEPMADVLNLQQMLMVQGYRIDGESRHVEAQKRAQARAALTRDLGDNASRYARPLRALNWAASAAARGTDVRDLSQFMKTRPDRGLADLLRQVEARGLLKWDGETGIGFTDQPSAAYLCGGWLEEFVLLKLTGLVRPGRFSSNLHVVAADGGVPNEIDAMVIHRNRALLIECKTSRQDEKTQDRIYKLAQLRDQLGGSVASALYLSAQTVSAEARRRAQEYRVDVLSDHEVSDLVPWLKRWLST